MDFKKRAKNSSVATNQKEPPEKYKEHLDEVNRLKNQLKRHFVDGDDDNVRYYSIPDNFVNRMDHVKEIQVIIKKLEIK